MKFGLFTQTKNVNFVDARQRVQPRVVELKKLLEPTKLPGRYNNLLLTFVDRPLDHFDVIEKGPNDDIFEIDVGFNTSGDYPAVEDAAVIRLLKEKLQLIFTSIEGFATRRQELLETVKAWADEFAR